MAKLVPNWEDTLARWAEGISETKTLADWKWRAVLTSDVEITKESPTLLHVRYLSVFTRIDKLGYLARADYQDKRRAWLGIVADALQKGLPIPEDDFDELALMLKQIADGMSPEKALGLDSDKRKQRSSNRLGKLHQIAHSVFYYSRNGHPLTEHSSAADASVSAIQKAADHFKVKARYAQEAWEIFGEVISRRFDEGLWNEPRPGIKKLTRKPRSKSVPRN